MPRRTRAPRGPLAAGFADRTGVGGRSRGPAERRRHIVEITPAGAAVLERIDQAVSEAERELFADLTEAERTLLRGLLDRVVVDPSAHECGEE